MKNISLFIAFTLLTLTACSSTKKQETPLTPETALQHYLDNGDKTYSWKVIETYDVKGVKAYDLILTSQKWRDIVWKHQLTVLVPPEVKYNDALLFITGGSINDKGEPNRKSHDDSSTLMFAKIAAADKAVVAIVRQTPNQPLFGGLVEDQMISYTLHQYKKDGDMTWPLLFPMVKSAVRAMDATQEFAKKELKRKINKFVVTGGSKRGWTTWLTGAMDKRVEAIAPMVIDVLNMPVSLNYQIEVWKEYSVQIEDYVKLEIPQQVETESGKSITQMIDPYSYRKKLTMPKLILIGTNDEYWPVDAIKNYLDSIPGTNLIHYVPNAGHNLDVKHNDQAPRAIASFFATTIMHKPYPVCKWNVSEKDGNVELDVKTSPDILVDALLWSAVSEEDRDFRNEKWTSESLNAKGKADIKTTIDLPKKGYKAFYIDLKYLDPNGNEYTVSTRMFVTDTKQIL